MLVYAAGGSRVCITFCGEWHRTFALDIDEFVSLCVQRVDSVEVQGPHGEGDHGRLRPQRPEERHYTAEHGTLHSLLQTLHFKDLGLILSRLAGLQRDSVRIENLTTMLAVCSSEAQTVVELAVICWGSGLLDVHVKLSVVRQWFQCPLSVSVPSVHYRYSNSSLQQ